MSQSDQSKGENGLPLRDNVPALYVPSWTAPGWKDDADARNGTDFSVHDPVKDVLRPMMLDTDRAKNPTKNALLAGNYFEIGDFQSNLRGPIDSLFSREKWDQSPPFSVADVRTVSFRLDGKYLDMEVERNDEVWNCLQPTLQMATRLFYQDDPFFKAVLDVGNWYKIPVTTNSKHQKAKTPSFKIELRRDKSEAIGYRHKIRPSATFNPMELTFKVLESRLKWRIASAHYDVESPIGKFDAETAFAVTRFNFPNPNTSICIDLAAEVIWQLLTAQLSSSEKTMVSWMLAATMVHELCVSNPPLLSSFKCMRWNNILNLKEHIY
ncbi:hypothetical protein A0O28_0036400 [Trichoderma guizhouense]|uniref:Uncharacterized protein n=1 Tax=Trichoderma guizhouense TaxID=1491466 RepID=A0A1T3CN72_9HYPO|nr:hypothetical protein A0O28_0036400 [Trichoderma guizhouense]